MAAAHTVVVIVVVVVHRGVASLPAHVTTAMPRSRPFLTGAAPAPAAYGPRRIGVERVAARPATAAAATTVRHAPRRSSSALRVTLVVACARPPRSWR